jgi:hypothetical protein
MTTARTLDASLNGTSVAALPSSGFKLEKGKTGDVRIRSFQLISLQFFCKDLSRKVEGSRSDEMNFSFQFT